jgi:hypothetical protein
MLKVMFEAKMLLVKVHRTAKIGDMNGDMVDALEHELLLGLEDRLSSYGFASLGDGVQSPVKELEY